MNNHELKFTGKIATRHLGQLIGPGQTILVTATHAVVMHDKNGFICPDIERAKRELNPAKSVSIEPNVSIGETPAEPVSVPTVELPKNVAATDTTVAPVTAEPVSPEPATPVQQNAEPVLPYPCTKCEEKFPSKRKLQIHMNSAHTTNASTSLV